MDLLTRYKVEELNLLIPFLGTSCKILEIGGGNGFQAKLLAEKGFEVHSIDIDNGQKWLNQYFPVAKYDGINLPFEDSYFDFIISSSVLEHVEDLPSLLLECKRVLKPTGKMAHILPSPMWKISNMLTYWVHLAERVLGVAYAAEQLTQGKNIVKKYSKLEILKKIIIPPIHGTSRSNIKEILDFRYRTWESKFKNSGFICAKKNLPIFYSGHFILKSLSFKKRSIIAKLTCPTVNLYLCEPKNELDAK